MLRAHWTDIQDALISDIDADYGVFDGRTFKTNRFEAFLARRDIPWPRLESGSLDLSRDTFRQMAKSYPTISPLRELRHALSEMRLNDLAVDMTDAIALYCPCSVQRLAAISRATQNIFLARARGCAV